MNFANRFYFLSTSVAFFIASFSAAAQQQGSGTINFYGKVIEAPCSVAPGSETQEVFLGEVAQKVLNANAVTSVAKFEIKLLDCELTNGSTPYSKVQVSFSGLADKDNPEVLANASANLNGAANVGVQLLDALNTPILLSGKTEIPLLEGSNTITLGARMVKTGSGAVTTGDVTATTTWTLNYQ